MSLAPASRILLAAVLAAGGAGDGPTAEAAPVVSASAYGIAVVVRGRRGRAQARATAPGPPDGSSPMGSPTRPTARSPDGRALVERRRAGHRHGGRPRRDGRALRLALQRRDHGRRAPAGRAKAGPAGADAHGLGRHQPRRSPASRSTAAPNQRFALGDWGFAVTLEQAVELHDRRRHADARAAVTALRVVLTADHGGLPAGSRDPRSATPRRPPSTPVGAAGADADRRRRRRSRGAARRARKRRRRSRCRSRPSPKRHARGRSTSRRRPTSRRRSHRAATSSRSTARRRSPTRSGAARAASCWHHGEDIFAPLGTPLLAVADGTVFSVGWNDLGGYRLWLRDRQGNQFYYAHLSAFSRARAERQRGRTPAT